MLKVDRAFSGFSINDLAVAKEFYGETHTMLNFPVANIDQAVDELTPAGNILSILQQA